MPKVRSNIAHLILAAGSSSRMGKPKQLLKWEDSTFIEQTIDRLCSVDEVKTFVVLGANYDQIYEQIKKKPIRIIRNSEWKEGMGTSIRMGMLSIRKELVTYDGVIVSVIDQPLLDQEYYVKLLQLGIEQRNSIIATQNEETIGVPAFFPKTYFKELSALDADYGARFIIKNHKNDVISISANGAAIDIDTPEHYRFAYNAHHLAEENN